MTLSVGDQQGAAPQIPHPQGIVRAPGSHVVSGGIEANHRDRVFVTREFSDGRAAVRVAELQATVVHSRGDSFSVLVATQRGHGRRTRSQASRRLGRFQIPTLQRSIVAAGKEMSAIGAFRERQHPAFMAAQGLWLLAPRHTLREQRDDERQASPGRESPGHHASSSEISPRIFPHDRLSVIVGGPFTGVVRPGSLP